MVMDHNISETSKNSGRFELNKTLSVAFADETKIIK